jgi:hypothetical protein
MQSLPTTLANRDDLAPRARTLLTQQFAECDAELGPLLQAALDDLERELLGIAEQSSGGQSQHEALESLREVKRTRSGFHAYLMALLEQRFADIGEPDFERVPETTSSTPELDLSLVDPDEFEERLALADLSARVEMHAGNALFALGHRYAVLISAPPLEADNLPPGPHGLAMVLSGATHTLCMQGAHRRLFYRLCDRRLCAAAEPFYDRLSEHLKSAGILAHLRNYLPRRLSAARREEPPSPESIMLPTIGPATNFSPRQHAATSAANPGATPHALPDPEPYTPQSSPANALATSGDESPSPSAIVPSTIEPTADLPPPQPAESTPSLPDMRTLRGLLNAGRRARQSGRVGTHGGRCRDAASLEELEPALAALQSQPMQAAAPRTGQHLHEELLAQLQRGSPNDRPRELQPKHRDAVELVGLLYDQLLVATSVGGATQRLLAQLQVPLLRVALSDSDFFTVRNHPARRLLNLVLETANLWLDLTDGNADSALNQRLQHAVERVAHDRNPDLFASEADDLDAYIKQLKRRAEIIERRHVEAAQGRERLLTAQASARAAVASRLATHDTTPLARALLERAWTDALTLAALREGESGEAYRRRLAVVDELLGSPNARDDHKLAIELERGLTEVGLPADEAQQAARHALDLPARTSDARPPVSQTALLIRLKSRPKPDENAAPHPAESREPRLTPAARKALDHLQTLPFGTWLKFTVNQQGQKVACKLAWYAPASGHCLLVNARGAVARYRTLEQVARLMAIGQAQLRQRPDGSLLDRAWGALIGRLQTFARNPRAPETTA